MTHKTNGRMTASEKVDQMIKGKPRKEQIAVLKDYINKSKNGHGAELDVYIAVVNKKVALECNGMSKKTKKYKPESEGIMKDDVALLSAKIALSMAGC